MSGNLEAIYMQIIIQTDNDLQSELLISYINKKIKKDCCIQVKSNEIYNFKNLKYNKLIILIDCINLVKKQIIRKVSDISEKNSVDFFFIILFNIDINIIVGTELRNLGVKGVIHTNSSVDTFIKGLLAVINGRLYFPAHIVRKTYEESLNEEEDSCELTLREKEILLHVALGMTNKEISGELAISIHTVKTHMYNIYKKLNISNRLQIILWTVKNL